MKPTLAQDPPPGECRYFYNTGACPYGEKCRVRHGARAPEVPRGACPWYFAKGACIRGDECKMRHSEVAAGVLGSGGGGLAFGLSAGQVGMAVDGETRRQGTDGLWYTAEQFQAYFGAAWRAEWAAAGPGPLPAQAGAAAAAPVAAAGRSKADKKREQRQRRRERGAVGAAGAEGVAPGHGEMAATARERRLGAAAWADGSPGEVVAAEAGREPELDFAAADQAIEELIEGCGEGGGEVRLSPASQAQMAAAIAASAPLTDAEVGEVEAAAAAMDEAPTPGAVGAKRADLQVSLRCM